MCEARVRGQNTSGEVGGGNGLGGGMDGAEALPAVYTQFEQLEELEFNQQ